MGDDFNELRDGLYDFNHNGKLDPFERNAQLDDFERFSENYNSGSYRPKSGSTKGSIFLVVALIVMCIPGCLLIGLLLLYLWWFFTKIA